MLSSVSQGEGVCTWHRTFEVLESQLDFIHVIFVQGVVPVVAFGKVVPVPDKLGSQLLGELERKRGGEVFRLPTALPPLEIFFVVWCVPNVWLTGGPRRGGRLNGSACHSCRSEVRSYRPGVLQIEWGMLAEQVDCMLNKSNEFIHSGTTDGGGRSGDVAIRKTDA